MQTDLKLQEKICEIIGPDNFRKMISDSAYFKSEKRGFIIGYEEEDWLEAEKELIRQCFYWFCDE